jgi:hypothetical protein
MITQILGVALISLLTITPTIKQNNINNLIEDNITILNNTLYPSRLHVVNEFAYYANGDGDSVYRSNRLHILNNKLVNHLGTDLTFKTGLNYDGLVNNIYITRQNNQANVSIYLTTGSLLRTILRNYYQSVRGVLPTSETFSFDPNNNSTSQFESTNTYTYTMNSTNGNMSGTIYVNNVNNYLNSTGNRVNSNVSLPTNSTMSQLINLISPTTNYTNVATNHIPLYYYFDSSINFNQAGTITRTLFSRTSWGFSVNHGVVTINLQADTTPPTITSINGNTENWINQSVTLTVQASDNNSLNTNAYSFDNGVTYQSSNFKIFTINEIVNIKVRDSSNNETSQQVIINRIDKQSPSINLAGNWKNTYELGELTSNNSLYNYLSISDGASGINSSLTTISNFNYNQAGTYTNVQISATDNAGNNFIYTAPTITITEPLDTSPPTISGSTTITRQQGNITTQDILSNFIISDPSGIEESRIQRLDNTIVTSWNDFTTGTYQLRVYARDTVGNIALYQFELNVTVPPVPDTTPPVITGSLITSFVIGTYTSTSEILALYTITDNLAVGVSQVIGTIDFEELGDYPVTISVTDTSNNTTTLNIVVRIRADVVLGNYNPLTDLLSGIFGGALSMIFTIGTINVLGLRLLDAMGVIILGAVLLFVYKAIKGGS